MKSSTDDEFQKRQPQVKTLGAASSLLLGIYIVFVEKGIHFQETSLFVSVH